jgi:hypothetical protein
VPLLTSRVCASRGNEPNIHHFSKSGNRQQWYYVGPHHVKNKKNQGIALCDPLICVSIL